MTEFIASEDMAEFDRLAAIEDRLVALETKGKAII